MVDEVRNEASDVVGVVVQAGSIGRDVIINYASHQAERFTDDPVGECPYRGLAAFGPDQAAWFFGREPA